jgi:hypothetical protein
LESDFYDTRKHNWIRLGKIINKDSEKMPNTYLRPWKLGYRAMAVEKQREAMVRGSPTKERCSLSCDKPRMMQAAMGRAMLTEET